MNKTLVQIYACKTCMTKNFALVRCCAAVIGSYRRVTSQKSRGLLHHGGSLKSRVALAIFICIHMRHRDIHKCV
jgi:hypothetical protein